MSKKSEILDAIRAHPMAELPLPDLNQAWTRYPDAFAQFKTMVELAGGRCVAVESRAEILPLLQANPSFAAADRVVSAIAEVPGNVDLNATDDPHLFADVDWAVLPCEFGVAENGAVWVHDATVKHRVIYFIAQHVALVMRQSEIVCNMHEAYDRVRVDQADFGAFVSGPSKTADIEQMLVIGAHGPRSLTLICTPD